ncbi:hydantoinase/oxoprolinase family protein [Enterovirga rhinocerotis]|uniref:N-methylhydantoinase A n=1 Tax=Enterovirga rhinocerotis TaxID=1339210 RepID=A0A4R7C9S5_9HYPH|nr:hydantoinase/oxoprolinase family protein [Enterovirga rhinocerotis]TDR95053.1 N-methylhydantoinase A [Enterovirga rhinocerotis]
MRVGIEIGGTFTDLVAAGPNGLTITKVPSVPARPDEGVFDALDRAGIACEAMVELAHGSTVATNAVLERKGARLAFLVTAGFGDVLTIQRLERRRIFDLLYRKPVPLVARKDAFEIPERTLFDGSIAEPLDTGRIRASLEAFLAAGDYGSVAICLLNSFANPDHERRLAELIRDVDPSLDVTCSYDISREYREYERATTTTMAAYVQPVIAAYLARMESVLASRGFAGNLSIMQSNGARMPAAAMRRNAVTALLSGPAAGVTGAVRQAGLSGIRNLVTLDIGGTSADVCLVVDGKPQLSQEAKIDGLPIRTPMVDIATVGAGGGSLVWADDGGMMRVGPQSAGANPGPACYGRGGTQPTLTDAHVLCGRLRPEARLAGSMQLDVEASRRVFAPIAERFGLEPAAAADSAVQIAIANVVAAIRQVSTERGRDTRDFTLVPFGGAGPLHAAAVAEALHIATVLVPPNAGVISAYGLLVSDHSLFESLTRPIPLDEAAPDRVRDTLGGLRTELAKRIEELGVPGDRLFEMSLDMRFKGQAFEITVPLAEADVPELTRERLLALFAREHEAIYSHGGGVGRNAVEIVSYRVGLHVPQLDRLSMSSSGAETSAEGSCEVFDRGERLDARLLWRGSLRAGQSVQGPAVIEDTTATIWIPKGWRGEIDGHQNLIMRAAA